MRRFGFLSLAFTLAAAGIAGCHSGSSGPIKVVDAQVFDVSLDLPPGCPPAGGNENGIGIPCTKGGGQCAIAGKPDNFLCTCDQAFGVQLSGVPCFCTIAGPNVTTNPDPCSTQASGFCGSNATCCPYMKEAYYCSPNVCLLPGGLCIAFTAADGGS